MKGKNAIIIISLIVILMFSLIIMTLMYFNMRKISKLSVESTLKSANEIYELNREINELKGELETLRNEKEEVSTNEKEKNKLRML